ncbi:MAG: DUF5050 domain-containing protein [Calditrichaeota bacterium]|nr:MAG: DUF5050 domain-containing protein [Calditrichota bacterium]
MKNLTKILLTMSLGLTLASSVSAQKMYYSLEGSQRLDRADIDGSNTETLVSTGENNYGTEVDLTNSKVYWCTSDFTNSKIRRADLDGSNAEIIVNINNNFFFRDVAIDLTNSKVYWTDGLFGTGGKIQRANLDGSSVEDILTNLDSPRSIDIDATNSKIYWQEDGSANRIRRADLDGSNIENLVTGLDSPDGIAVDVTNSKIYWSEGSGGSATIKKANLDGSSITTLITNGANGLNRPRGIDIDETNSKMYFADRNGNKIQRSDLDGSNVEDLVTSGISSPFGVSLGVTDTPLAVELDSFTTRQIENAIQLFWSTASEKDNEGFNVYRKTGNGFYTQIASYKGNSELLGALNSSTSNNYSFTDNSELRNGETYTYYISDIETNGLETKHEEQAQSVRFTLNEEIAQTKLDYVLAQNFPNPFNPSTKINFQIAKEQDVKLEVYNLKGELVKELVNEKMNKGSHSAKWNGTDTFGNQVSSGTYFYKISAGTFIQTNKMILLK